MGLIKRLLGGSEDRKEFKDKFKQAQQDDKISRMVEERKMSSNERDLLKRLEQQRQDEIKIELDKMRKKESSELWKSSNSVLKGGTSILKEDKPILKEKNIFQNNPNLFSREHSIKNHTNMGFFK